MGNLRTVVVAALAVIIVGAMTACTNGVAPAEYGAPQPTIESAADTERVQIYLVAADGAEWTATAVHAGDPDPDPATSPNRFATEAEAITWATGQPSDWGVRVEGR
ncbi:hypothetical protein [Leifsonia aquatica]|uniref:hypothetical protein n=1 Tax=Leifsonia aquatica TaxID=144185 RepID=UPI0013B3B426|nr:hypothetical protein [Leifsonia aquatica]